MLTDGKVMIACRWNHSLFTVRREGVYECEICGIPHIEHDDSVVYQAMVFASEPISDESWSPLKEHSLAVVDHAMEWSSALLGVPT